MSKTPYFRWEGKYGGMGRGEVQWLRQLEKEDRWLERLVADLSPDNAMLRDVVGRKW